MNMVSPSWQPNTPQSPGTLRDFSRGSGEPRLESTTVDQYETRYEFVTSSLACPGLGPGPEATQTKIMAFEDPLTSSFHVGGAPYVVALG